MAKIVYLRLEFNLYLKQNILLLDKGFNVKSEFVLFVGSL